MNYEFISCNGVSTGSIVFKMAVVAILDFSKLLPFLYYSNNCGVTIVVSVN